MPVVPLVLMLLLVHRLLGCHHAVAALIAWLPLEGLTEPLWQLLLSLRVHLCHLIRPLRPHVLYLVWSPVVHAIYVDVLRSLPGEILLA